MNFLDKLLRRGLRNLKLIRNDNAKNSKFLNSFVDKFEARKKVQSLYDWDEEKFDVTESKFNMEAFHTNEPENIDRKNLQIIKELSVPSIINFININCSADNLKLYLRSTSVSSQDAQIILSLPNATFRRSLMLSIVKSFKHLFPKRFIQIDGEKDKNVEWIVINLKVATVHIMDPEYRNGIGLDEKFEAELLPGPVDDIPQFLDKFTKNPPYSISRKPNFIEKFIKNRDKE